MDTQEALLELSLETDLQTVPIARCVQNETFVPGDFLYMRWERSLYLSEGSCRCIEVCHCQLLILEQQQQDNVLCSLL